MPYDVSLDQCLFSKTYENDLGRLTVGVHSYNNGVKKSRSAGRREAAKETLNSRRWEG
ncbi:MAG: hypothetical protein HQ547_05710 [Candidatus Omnitrophica bacterium]|nr:hypothetical protein [Candidatus Omnitrophota bacterium]